MSSTIETVQKLRDFVERRGVVVGHEKFETDRECWEYQSGMERFVKQLLYRGVDEDEAKVLWVRLSGHTIEETASVGGKDSTEVAKLTREAIEDSFIRREREW